MARVPLTRSIGISSRATRISSARIKGFEIRLQPGDGCLKKSERRIVGRPRLSLRRWRSVERSLIPRQQKDASEFVLHRDAIRASLTMAPLGAIAHFMPNLGPLAAPAERTLANSTNLFGKVGFKSSALTLHVKSSMSSLPVCVAVRLNCSWPSAFTMLFLDFEAFLRPVTGIPLRRLP